MKTNATKQYAALKEEVRKFISDIKNRKANAAYFYKASEAPMEIVAGAPPQQFNVLEVRMLIGHVLTAKKLGYETLLTANGDSLYITFAEKYPNIPIALEYMK